MMEDPLSWEPEDLAKIEAYTLCLEEKYREKKAGKIQLFKNLLRLDVSLRGSNSKSALDIADELLASSSTSSSVNTLSRSQPHAEENPSSVNRRDSNTTEAASLSIDAEPTSNDAEILNRVDSSAETQLPDQPTPTVEDKQTENQQAAESGEGQQNKSMKRKREEDSVQEQKQPEEESEKPKEVKKEGGNNNDHAKSKRTPEHNKGPEKKKRKTKALKQQKPAFQWIGEPIKVQGGRKYFKGLERGGVKYSVGDAVALRGPGDELWYLQITSLSKIGKRRYIAGNWLYKPEHTDTGRLPSHHLKELFQSTHKDKNNVESLVKKIIILPESEFFKPGPKPQTWLVRQKYSHNTGKFSKIK